MNKKLIVVLFGFLFALAAAGPSEDEGNFTVDQAANILTDLLQDAQHNLQDLQGAWAVKKPILEEIIANLEQDLQNKQNECSHLDEVLANREKELGDAEDYVAWLEKRIQENTDRIKALLERRCQQNGNYIEGLKNDKLALKLLQFLRLQIQNKESFDFAQRKAFMRNLQSFLQVYKTGSFEQLSLLEKQLVDSSQYDVNANYDTQDRSAEEIGSGHVDNDQGNHEVDQFQNGERKGWYQVKQEILALLENLEKTINDKIVKGQEDEIRSNSAAADYKIQLEHEIEVYQKELAKWNQVVVDLKNAVENDKVNVSQCRSEEASLQGELEKARQNLAEETARFEHKQSNLQEEIQIFEEVIALYTPSHSEQGADFKERVEDFNDNQNFDDGSYNEREVPKIDLLNGF